MLNIIVLWQTVYTQAALDHLAANGPHADPADVARLPARPPNDQPQRPLPDHQPPTHQRTPTPPHTPMTGPVQDPVPILVTGRERSST